MKLRDTRLNIREEANYRGVVDCVQKTFRNEGILAFYKGVVPNLIKLFPSSGLFFYTYETSLRLLNSE